MKYFFLLFIKIILVSNLYSKDFNEYKFNWYPRIMVEDDIIVFPDSSKYETYNSTGVWEDNFGNYGIMKCLVSQFINGNQEITLDGYCEASDHKEERFWMSLKRQSFNKAGVGKSKYIYTENKYNIFQGKECPYAAQLIEGGGVFKLICKLTKNEYAIFKSKEIIYN